MISTMQLQAIFPHAGARLPQFVQPLNDAMTEFQITTARREAAFLAQIAHESGELQFLRELADGSAYEPPSEKAVELGNTQPGDGPRFRGRGLLQITGRTNYQRCGAALGLDLTVDPMLLEQPENAARSAGWFWSTHGLNSLADQNAFGSVTHRINGGFNGMDSRLGYWLLALRATGAW